LLVSTKAPWIISVALVATACSLAAPAQVRGVYPTGMSATNSGVTAGPGLTYSNLTILFARDTLRGTNGEITATGENSVLMNMNTFVWVSRPQAILGGVLYSTSATLPIANNSLTSDVNGTLGGGAGFADSYYQPVILGWRMKRADVRAIYGFLAPTGRFNAGADNNVGSGYWTNVPASGQTFYLTRNKATAISAFEMYEFHGTQEGTSIHPGETFDLDYSLTQNLQMRKDLRLQLGLVGYGQYQTTNKNEPDITPTQAEAHYRVNSLGFASNVILPAREVNLASSILRSSPTGRRSRDIQYRFQLQSSSRPG